MDTDCCQIEKSGADTFFLYGDLCHAPVIGRLDIHAASYLLCKNGQCAGIFKTVPPEFASVPVLDYGGCLIMPGMVDLHIHASQFAYRGTGMDCELLDWLARFAFPEESRYADPDYAAGAYGIFAGQMRKSATTRAVIFGTIHREATLLLMDLMEKTGIVSYVGKVNMDRDAPPALREPAADLSAFDTFGFVNAAAKRNYRRTKPILTPRFIPCCSDSLLSELSEVRRTYDLPVQSHLSENPGEVELVKKLMPDARFYGDGYDRYGLFGNEARTVMAHCVYSSDEEIRRLLKNGVWVAHCPNSNMNLASGIAPVRRYLDLGMRVGLGSDVAGGQTESMFRAVTDAIQVSKLYWRHIDSGARPLTFPESFYMATRGGGSFFGKVGSFADGFAFDALVLDDAIMPTPREFTVEQRLERAFYLGLDQLGIRAKFADGRMIYQH